MSDVMDNDTVLSPARSVLGHSSLDGAARQGRRLTDKILVAFHHACDAQDLTVADQLLRTLERLVTSMGQRPDPNRRKGLETLVAAHERLWHLRHQDRS